MRGTVDSWTESTGTGTILGDDAQAYAFSRADVIEGERTLPGAKVAFTASHRPDQAIATGIKVLRGVALAASSSGVVVTDMRLPFVSVFWLVLQVAIVSFLVSLVVLAFGGLLRFVL